MKAGKYFSQAGRAALLIGSAGVFWARGTFQPVEARRLFCASLIMAVPLWGWFISSAWKAMDGAENLWRDLTGLVAVSLPGFLMIGFIGLLVLNGAGDRSPAQRREVLVVRKHIEPGHRMNSYYLTVAPWRDSMQAYRFHVGCGLYDRAVVGQPCILMTRPGAARFEWVVTNSCQ